MDFPPHVGIPVHWSYVLLRVCFSGVTECYYCGCMPWLDLPFVDDLLTKLRILSATYEVVLL